MEDVTTVVTNIYKMYKKRGLGATLEYIHFSFQDTDIQKVIDYLKKNKIWLPKDAMPIIDAVEKRLKESKKII